MALLTTLTINDIQNEYKVADFRMHMARSYNQFNPDSAATCERIEMTVVAPNTEDYTFYEWFKNRSKLSGQLAYELPVSLNHTYSETRIVKFKDAQCYAFTESYDINSKSRRLLKIMIVPNHVDVEKVEFDKL